MKIIIFSLLILIHATGCTLRPEAFIINRSGEDIVIFIEGRQGRLLGNGYDTAHSPLRSSYFTNAELYIGKCETKKYYLGECNDIPRKKYGKAKEMVIKIEEYYKNNGSRAAYLFDKNENLTLVPYNSRPKAEIFTYQ